MTIGGIDFLCKRIATDTNAFIADLASCISSALWSMEQLLDAALDGVKSCHERDEAGPARVKTVEGEAITSA